MKTDFTATGKRTKKGAMNDGVSAVKRFVLGNFYDSRTQDYIDFSLNKLKPKRNAKDRIRHSPLNSVFMIVALVIFFLMQLILIPIITCAGVDTFTD